MPAQVTNYKCPACTGPLHFVGESGKLECDYCGSTYDVAEIEALIAEEEAKAEQAFTEEEKNEWNTSELNDDWGEDGEHMRMYCCPSCGAELICDDTTAATSCPYCGNPTIIPGQFKGSMKPDYIIPFKLDKKTAIESLKKHYNGKKFLPNAFKEENHIEEIKGIYVPFWMFDGEADASLQFKATNSIVTREGDYEVTTTKHYDVCREGTLSFQRIPVDASTKMPDEHMDSIEPYDYTEIKPFSTSYLPGFLADKYDVSIDECAKRADERCFNAVIDALKQTITQPYASCVLKSKNIKLKRNQVKYALLPVWMLHTKWKDQDFLFAMNGQTGKMVGDLPMDWGKCIAMFAKIAIPIAVVLAVIMFGLL